jgi:predicted transcriptional regulator
MKWQVTDEKKVKFEKLVLLNKALERGIADAEAGRVMDVDDVFRRLRWELAKVG